MEMTRPPGLSMALGLTKHDTALLRTKQVFWEWDLETESHVTPFPGVEFKVCKKAIILWLL